MRSSCVRKGLVVAGLVATGWSGAGLAADRETVTPQFARPLPNVPGKSLTVVRVDYAPAAKSCPHHHAGSGVVSTFDCP